MADKIQLRRDTPEAWAAANPILSDGEPGIERGTHRVKNGDGVTHWNDLPYWTGEKGDKGDKGDFLGITDLMGTSATSLELSIGVKSLVATLGKSWRSGLFVMISSTANPENYIIGQVAAYDSTTGAMTVNVGAGGVQGVGTFASWNISYAPGAGIVYNHANMHLPGGSDAIPEATSAVSGLMPAEFFDKINGIHAGAIYVQDSQPQMLVNDIWISTSAQVKTAPVISAVYPQHTTLNTAKDIGVTVYDVTDTNSVYLTFASSNTAFLPLADITTSGAGGTRNVHVAAIATAGESVITVTATNASGGQSSINFLYKVVTTAQTITATTKTVTISGITDTFGDISPAGTIVVPTGSEVHFTGMGNPGYAVSVMRVDGVDYAQADYTLSDVQADHTVEATFAPAFKIAAAASLNGSVMPSGDVWVCAGQSKTFTFVPDAGFQTLSYILDGVTHTDVSGGSVTINSIAANHNLIVTYSGLAYTITKNAGTHGSITGPSSASYSDNPTFAFTPDSDYEVADSSYIIGSNSEVVTGAVTGITIPAPINGNIVVAASFRIMVPAQVTGLLAVDAGLSTQINLSWAAASRATTYTIYWSNNGADLTATQIIARGNTPLTTVSTSINHTGLTQDVAYRYCMVASNGTGAGLASTVVTGTPTANTIPASTIVATLPTVTSATAVQFSTDGSSTGDVVWEYNIGTATIGTFECDFYDTGVANHNCQMLVYGESGRTTAAYVGVLTSIFGSQYRVGCTASGSLGYATRTVGWHHAKINVTGNSSAEIWLDGMLCYQGSLATSGLGTAGGLIIRLRVQSVNDAAIKTGYFANIKYNSTDISVATQGSWTVVSALGTTTWGV